jgi:hypothetical protein
MRAIFLGTFAAATLFASPAYAYKLKSPSNPNDCAPDGSPCTVMCDNGSVAGVMYWNGSVWTDGVKSDANREAEARKICAANGTDCT